jgi:hypothetical protein
MDEVRSLDPTERHGRKDKEGEADPASGAWAAGLLAGTGCFSAGNGRPTVEVGAPDRETVERFHTIVRVGTIVEAGYPAVTSRVLPLFLWYCSGRDEISQLKSLLDPWLGPCSKKRFDLTLHGNPLEEQPVTDRLARGDRRLLRANADGATHWEPVRPPSRMARVHGARRRRRLPPGCERRKEGP